MRLFTPSLYSDTGLSSGIRVSNDRLRVGGSNRGETCTDVFIGTLVIDKDMIVEAAIERSVDGTLRFVSPDADDRRALVLVETLSVHSRGGAFGTSAVYFGSPTLVAQGSFVCQANRALPGHHSSLWILQPRQAVSCGGARSFVIWMDDEHRPRVSDHKGWRANVLPRWWSDLSEVEQNVQRVASLANHKLHEALLALSSPSSSIRL